MLARFLDEYRYHRLYGFGRIDAAKLAWFVASI